jgi:hypothetical protein
MYIPKRYGESRVDSCPFCGRQAIINNPQGIPVCVEHKNKDFPDMKCTCGSYLMIQKGKFGVFFNCLKCGNMNLRKVLEINPNILHAEKAIEKPKEKINRPNNMSSTAKKQESRNETIRSDDPRYFW